MCWSQHYSKFNIYIIYSSRKEVCLRLFYTENNCSSRWRGWVSHDGPQPSRIFLSAPNIDTFLGQFSNSKAIFNFIAITGVLYFLCKNLRYALFMIFHMISNASTRSGTVLATSCATALLNYFQKGEKPSPPAFQWITYDLWRPFFWKNFIIENKVTITD